MKSYLLLAALLGQFAVNVFLVAKLHLYENHRYENHRYENQRYENQTPAARLPTMEQPADTESAAAIAAQVRQQVDQSLQQLMRSKEFHAALGEILRDNLNNHQFAVSDPGQNELMDELQQSGASSALVETIYAETQNIIAEAISAGVWTAEDSDVLTQNLTQLQARQQTELMKVFVGAVNRQELRPEGIYFPF